MTGRLTCHGGYDRAPHLPWWCASLGSNWKSTSRIKAFLKLNLLPSKGWHTWVGGKVNGRAGGKVNGGAGGNRKGMGQLRLQIWQEDLAMRRGERAVNTEDLDQSSVK